MIFPKKWNVYNVDLEPRAGTKPGKQRPCICIQPTEFCAAGLGSSLIIPLTTSVTNDSDKLLFQNGGIEEIGQIKWTFVFEIPGELAFSNHESWILNSKIHK
jgi:mRNA-degrading endonuclease toxin of MazEF toxin-antitoxin module